jgi:alkylhydroperoxidase family enzyme
MRVMANISFKLPDEIEEHDCRQWMLDAMAAGKPGPEFQAIRAHVPGVMRSFTRTREWIYHEGVLDFDLKELLRAYIALSGDCTYCGGQGIARGIRDDSDELDELLNYERSDKYSDREKLALRYADAIMWNPELADEIMWKELRDEFAEPELVELGYWIGFTFGGQRWLRTLGSTQGQLQAALDDSGVTATVTGHNTKSD